MVKKSILLIILTTLMMTLISCTNSIGEETVITDDSFIFIYDMTIQVDEIKEIVVQTNLDSLDGITYQASGDGILVDQNRIYGLKAGTTTEVTAILGSLQSKFNVIINAESTAVSGSLFDEITIEPIAELNGRNDFIMGVDLSSIVEVMKRGGKFYDETGNRTSIYQLLKDNGVNYIRIRLFNDPVSPLGIPYGGGNNDIEVAKKIGHDAKLFGMKILLDFHYSDFWADPGKQVIPKDWANLETSTEVASAIYDFTFDVMEKMEAAGAKVDMVQIGNEIAPGLLTQGTSNYEDLNTDNPPRYQLPSTISGSTGNVDNFVLYLKAGLNAAKDQNPDVLTMIHIDRGGNNSFYRTFYDRLEANNVDFDIIGMSYYVFYHGQLSGFINNINDMASRYNKPIIVAETSYAFTNQPTANASHVLSTPYYDYPLSVQGQADITRDIIEVVAKVEDNLGYGIFYWEPAWLPVAGAGWAGAGSPITWANQALFSYQGISLPSLALFNEVKP